jgi:aspartate ammonia-lyase
MLFSCQVRTYVADIAGGTATASIQMQAKQTFAGIAINGVNAAVGSYEVSKSATSQIGTAQPTQDVIARFRISGTAGQFAQVIPVKVPVVAFQSLYVHCTGAGNIGDVTFF